MNEDEIIKERVTISDANYKRLFKLVSSVKDTSASTGDDKIWASLAVELESFEAMLIKLQLQLDTSAKELAIYENQKQLAESQILELNSRTDELLSDLAEAEVERQQKQECNRFIEDMLKTKKVVVNQVPIIAKLDSSREDDVKLCASLEEDIEELLAEKAKLEEQWALRREKYDGLIDYVENFRRDVLSIAKAQVPEDEAEIQEEGSEELQVKTESGEVDMEEVPVEDEASKDGQEQDNDNNEDDSAVKTESVANDVEMAME